ncbi:MAG TPA: amidohydrolase family protein, partial [Kofleriaceae bacterium]|nr:amidohydrolase family protein [Kofleriaceae bacterium]
VDDLKARVERGEAVGPHIFRSGFIEGRGTNAASSRITAETEDEARAAVAFFADRGYEGIKIYNSMKAELVPLLAKLARARGLRVSGHVPVYMRAEEVVRAGYDEIQHANMLFLNFLVDQDTDTRTPVRFTLVGDRAAEVDLDGAPMKAFIALLLEKKTVVDPTLNAFEDLFVGRPGQVLPGWAPVVDRLPVQVQRWFKTGGLPASGDKIARYRDSYRRMLELVRRLHDAGVPLVAGTDSLAGFGLHRELELYAEAGIPAADVLLIATLGAARVMKRDKTSGSIARGKAADLVLVDGDPLADISDLRKTVLTIKGGVVYRPEALHQAIGIRPR